MEDSMEDTDRNGSTPSKSGVPDGYAHRTIGSTSQEKTLPREKFGSTSAISKLEAELLQRVSDFLKEIYVYSRAMPSRLINEMEYLKSEAETMFKRDQNSNPWTCEIDELTMDDWKRDNGHPLAKKPVPVLQVYYQRPSQAISLDALPGTISQAPQNMALDIIGDQKNLQRIRINSTILHAELESIMSATIRFPIITGPPYKMLLQYLPGFRTRLTKLGDELAETTPEIDTNDYQANNKPRKEPDMGVDRTIRRHIGFESNEVGKKLESYTEESDSKSDDEAEDRDVQSRPSHLHPSAKISHLKLRMSHLQVLVDFLDDSLGGLIKLRDDIKSKNLEKIAFDDLWHLFQPGDLVFSKNEGQEQLHRVNFVTGGQKLLRNPKSLYFAPPHDLLPGGFRTTSWDPFKVDTYMMGFNGNEFGPEGMSWEIKHYLGKKLVTELPIYPAHLHPESKNLLARMEARGRKFMKSLGHKYYDGLAKKYAQIRSSNFVDDVPIKYPSPFNRPDEYKPPRKLGQEYITSEVFVDFEAYHEINRHYKPNFGKLFRSTLDPHEIDNPVYSDVDIDTQLAEDYLAQNRDFLEFFKPTKLDPSAEYLQLLPSEVPAYTFRYRMWYLLNLDNLHDIDTTQNSGFDDLVIPERHRSLLVALVDKHNSGFQRRQESLEKRMKDQDNAQVDLVPGKGQGLIILLHGPPGSGKTSTAETVAAYTRRPLYAITCGDLGLDPKSVEEQLSNHAARAEKWGCVLLLDEADVFLVSRTYKELKRNALVSVFLRQLEYYSGILFLTTNRPGTLDEAFKSRIHVSLRYAELDLASTLRMWNNILRRLEVENKTADIKVKFDPQELLDFCEQHFKNRQKDGKTWNGRQIRNAFQTALALGHFDRQERIKASGQTLEEVAEAGKTKWMKVKLTRKNFRSIARTMHEFEDYIVKLRGKDSDLALEGEVRDDYYDPNSDTRPVRKNYAATLLRRRSSLEPTDQHWTDRAYAGRTRKRQASTPVIYKDDDDDDDDDDDEEEDEDDDDEYEVEYEEER